MSARGSANFLSRATAITATIFMIMSVVMTIVASSSNEKKILESLPNLETNSDNTINIIEEEKNINILIVAANTNEKESGPGPIINSLVTKEITNLRIPVMIVPGNLSKEHISQITKC